MSSWILVALVILGGAMIAFQGPVNASLRNTIGIYESTFISFAGGAVISLVVVLLFGTGDMRRLPEAPPWQYMGGALGIVIVTILTFAIPRIGVATAMVAVFAGQLASGLVIDRFGWFGVPVRTLEWQRVAGVLLLFVALYLINGKR
jgi:bacterial/archaeal transporter family-2 protein